MSKFKVRCTKANDNRFILGKVYDVTNNGRIWDENGFGGCCNTTESFEAWHKDCCWTDYAFELVAEHRHSIHITCTDNKTTHAVKKVDGEIVARSKAVCCPTDEFNANIGAQLAFNRLVYGTDYNPAEVALKPEQPKREDKHTYKAGDKVKVVNNTCGHGQKIGGVITLNDNDVQVERNAWHFKESAGYITECDFEPYAEPESTEPKQEPVKLYCVKDRSNYVGTLTKGKVYEFVSGSGLTYDNGAKSIETRTYERWARDNRETSPHLVPLVSRPAKVGEWVRFKVNYEGDLVTGTLHKVESVCSGIMVFKRGYVCSNPEMYEVLDGYKPEPEKAEPEYLNMRVVCVAGSRGFTVGKVYEFKSGVVADDDGDVRPSNGDQKITSLSDAYLRDWANEFIEFKGE